MDARLVGSGVTAANEKHAELLLGLHDKDEFNIGRSIEADCLIRDVNISRKHAQLKFDKGNNTWTITDNKSANGVMINDSRLTPLNRHSLKNGDRISIPSTKHTYVWIYQIQEEEVLKDVAKSPGKHRAENINHQIDESQQFQLEQILKEKEELDSKVKDGEFIREKLAKEKDDLAQTLISDRARFIENQEKERKDFEQKLSANREETIESQRKEFETKLANEKELMDMNQRQAEETLAKKFKEAEDKISNALNDRDNMVSKMEEEKLKAEMILEEEKKKYEKQVADLEKAFKDEKDNANEYKEALEKINSEFQENLKSGRKDFEEAIEKEKADKEAERSEKEKMRTELQTREEEISELRAELDRKRKRDDDREDSLAKRSRSEDKARFLEKCNDELKCSICDDIFIEPMSLNCGHVYCHYCIEDWKTECKKKTQFTCPNCRSKITTTIRSLHLDNLVNAIFRDADEEIKKDREELIHNRKAAQQKKLSNASKQVKGRKGTRGNQIAESIRPMLQNRSNFFRVPTSSLEHRAT